MGLRLCQTIAVIFIQRILLQTLSLLLLAAFLTNAQAQENTAESHLLAGTLSIEVEGINQAMLGNVQASVSAFEYVDGLKLGLRHMRSLKDDASLELSTSLQTFGFYHPELTITVTTTAEGWHWLVQIDPGPAVTITELNIEISGEGATNEDFALWRENLPLNTGKHLQHQDYEEAKQLFTRTAESLGFLDAEIEIHEVLVNAETNEAVINLKLATGPQFVFGDIDIQSADLNSNVIEKFRIIKPGTPYTSERLNDLRSRIASSLYFKFIKTETSIDKQTQPPRVNISIRPQLRERNRYKATLGYGTDRGARVQLGWERRLLSARGDRLELGLGFQQQDSEIVLRADYKLPVSSKPGRFFVSSGLYFHEQDDFRFIDDNTDEGVFPAIEGPRDIIWVRAGMLREFWLEQWREPIRQTIFMGYLYENFDALSEANPAAQELIEINPGLEKFLRSKQSSTVLGAEWQWLNMNGSGFDSEGLHLRARALYSNTALGSDIDYWQTYLGGHYSLRFTDRWKLTLRAEGGYSDASVTDLLVADGADEVNLSITELPSQFRFRAGGTYSVRGYGFEELSNNENGSNNLLSASTEIEYKLGENWSLAAFADTGNAFNDFSQLELKTSLGIGLRFYTMVGPVRLDLAKGINDSNTSITIHFSIGSPLLNLGRSIP